MKITCIISEGENKQRYCVRNSKNLPEVDALLANVTDRLTQLVSHLNQKWGSRDFVKRVVENFNPNSIQATMPTDTIVAYTENKGDKMAFCPTTKKNAGELIDLNTLMYVAVHELAHVACESVGHTGEFWKTFRKMLIEAARIKIYKPVNYSIHPVPYCGTNIDENILFEKEGA